MAFQRDMSLDLSKPIKGEYILERRETRAQRVAAEQREMQAALKRDQRKCRVPRCEYAKRDLPIDPAHLVHRGMGGDKSLTRTTRDGIVSLCRIHHSLFDRAELGIEPLTSKRADGPLSFFRRTESGRMEHVVSEKTIGVSETRGA